VALHQDVWNWSRTTLYFGFLPVTLAYHMGISVAAAATWYLATKVAWPAHLDREIPRQEGQPQ
jgi:hypothetical protein